MNTTITNEALKTIRSRQDLDFPAFGIMICMGNPSQGCACNKKVKGYKRISWDYDEAAFATLDGAYRIEVIKLRQPIYTKKYEFWAVRVFDIGTQSYVTEPQTLSKFHPYDFMHS